MQIAVIYYMNQFSPKNIIAITVKLAVHQQKPQQNAVDHEY